MVWVLLMAGVAGALGDVRLAAGVVTISGALLLCFQLSYRRTTAVILLAALSALWGLIAANDEARDRAAFARHRSGCVEGWVSAFPSATRYGATFLVDTTVGGRSVSIRVRSRRFDVNYGERYRVQIAPVRKWWPRAGVAGEARAVALERLPGTAGNALSRRVFWPAHRRARVVLSRRLGTQAALPLALALGERGYLYRNHRPRFVRLGISHLFALSGMHLGVIAAAVLLVVRGRSRRTAVVTAAALTGFVLVVGDIDSLQRALVMTLLAFAARALCRPVRSLDVWATAGCILIWENPPAVRSVGLQFSMLATLGVLVAVTRSGFLASWIRGAGWLARWAVGVAGTLMVGTAATLVVMPLQLRYFGEVSLAGPAATVVFLPVAGGLLVATLALVLFDPLGAIAAPAAELVIAGAKLLDWMLWRAGGFVPDPIRVAPPDAFLYYSGLALAVAGEGRISRGTGVALVLFAFLAGS